MGVFNNYFAFDSILLPQDFRTKAFLIQKKYLRRKMKKARKTGPVGQIKALTKIIRKQPYCSS